MRMRWIVYSGKGRKQNAGEVGLANSAKYGIVENGE